MLRAKKLVATFVLGVAIVGATAGQAWAPHVFFGSTGMVPCTSPVTGLGVFRGSFSLDHFESRGGQLYALGSLSGSCESNADTNNVVTFDATALIAVPVSLQTTKCTSLDLTLGPATDSKSLTVPSWTESILATTDAATGQLCALGAQSGRRADADLVKKLNLLLSKL